jgi:hypothetical protein
MSVLDAAGPKLPRRETGKVTQRLVPAAGRRLSWGLREAHLNSPRFLRASSLSALKMHKTKHLQLVSWILFPPQRAIYKQERRRFLSRNHDRSLCWYPTMIYSTKQFPGRRFFLFWRSAGCAPQLYSKVLWLNGRNIELKVDSRMKVFAFSEPNRAHIEHRGFLEPHENIWGSSQKINTIKANIHTISPLFNKIALKYRSSLQ